MVLNMISTSIMIKLGKVKGNKMVDMKLSNNKLRRRGEQILHEEYGICCVGHAAELLEKYGSVRAVIEKLKLVTKAT